MKRKNELSVRNKHFEFLRLSCLVFLFIPQFFSRIGRYTLTCYALVLILTGPATNTLKNSEVLSESMACNQEQIKTSMNHISDSISNPFNTLKDWMGVAADKIRGIAVGLRTTLVATHRTVVAIAHVLESSYPWLNSITNRCNKELGTPHQHCHRVWSEGVYNSENAPPPAGLLWNATYLANIACDSLKAYTRFCEIADYTRTTIVATMKRRVRDFAARVQSLLRVKVHVHHSYSFSSNASRSASQAAAGTVTEIRNRAEPLLAWLSWSSCVTSLFLFLIIFRAKNYQHMYETRSRFDNRYITKELRNLDFERLKAGKETVLPLNRIEKAKYITTTSFRLLASEKVYLERSIVHMVITTFKLLIHMVADYSLYWVLMTIRYHGRFQTPLEPGPTDAGVQVSGTGPVAQLVRSLTKVLTLPLSITPPSVVTCLPNPRPPDVHRYTQIGVLICLLWSSALFEPYGLRLRHVIMGLYRPERAKARALWLYNHILRTRGGLMKFARRKLHKEYKYSNKDEMTFVQWLDSHIPWWWLRYLLGTLPKDPCCLLCNIVEEVNSFGVKLCRCDTPKCPGIYCAQCFNDLGQLCTICLNPIDYGDLSDISLENDSKRPFSDKEKSRSKKGSNKDDAPEKADPDESKEAGKGDEPNEDKLDSKTSNQKNILTHKWFDNYYSLHPNASSFSLKTILRAKKTAPSMSTDFGMSRSLRYYCSIGNTEFDQIDCPDQFKAEVLTSKTWKKENIALLPINDDSEYSPLKRCYYSSEDSSVALNFKAEFDLLSRPVRNIKIKSIKHAMSDRILHLRLRNPFPLMRDFYSSLLDAKMRRTNDRCKDTKNGKCKAVAVRPKRKTAICQCEGSPENLQETSKCLKKKYSVTGYDTGDITMLDCACETGEPQLLSQYKPTQDQTSQLTSPNQRPAMQPPQASERKRVS
ncbi:unnamed protein product, partial [Iphiclides podalirius]